MKNGAKSEKQGGAVGLRHVAQKAGTSVAAASAVLSPTRSNTRVSPETRQRILQTAHELKYQPNALARALTGKPTRTIGVLFGLERASVAIANPYIYTVLQGIVDAAAASGYNVTLFTEPWHDAARSSGMVRDGRTDGVLVVAPSTNSDVIATLADFGIAVVSVATPREAELVPSVDIDNAQGAKMATEYLISLRHTRIAHLSGDLVLRSAGERQAAFLSAMAKANLPVPSEYLLAGEYTAHSGHERTVRLLRLPHPPTAIFAAGDEIAHGALQATREAGIAVPGDLSVVGFNDLPPDGWGSVPLTTIRQPLTDIGAAAARLLLQTIQGEGLPPNRAHLFPPELIIRASTGPCLGRI